MAEDLREFVRRRAGDRCGYCHLPQAGHEQPFSVDHVVARKHRGPDHADNLALCCLRCNLHKGTDLTSIDPETGALTPLFNPRTQSWSEHFRWDGPMLRGLTSVGRTTVELLQMNDATRVL